MKKIRSFLYLAVLCIAALFLSPRAQAAGFAVNQFLVSSAYSIPGVTTNSYAAADFIDIPIPAAQAISSVGPAIQVNMVGTNVNALATNVVTFAVSPSVGGTNFSTVASQQFIFAVPLNGTNPVVFSTNMPITSYQMRSKLRLLSIGNAAGDTNGITISSIHIGQTF